MIERHRGLLRIAFVVYAIVLFVATHKPGVDVNIVPGIRLDLFIHAAAFGTWTFLLGLTGWLGDISRPGRVLVLASVGVIHAVADESSQALPIFDRVFDLRDMAANAGGVLCASVLAHAFARTLTRREADRP